MTEPKRKRGQRGRSRPVAEKISALLDKQMLTMLRDGVRVKVTRPDGTSSIETVSPSANMLREIRMRIRDAAEEKAKRPLNQAEITAGIGAEAARRGLTYEGPTPRPLPFQAGGGGGQRQEGA